MLITAAASQLPGRPGDAVGAAGAVGRGHLPLAAEGLDGPGDALVVGQHHHAVEPAGPRHPLVDVLDHRPAGDRQQRLSGQPGRAVAGRDGAHDTRAAGRAVGAGDAVGCTT